MLIVLAIMIFTHFIMYAYIEYQVVINLHHDGVVLSSRETKGGTSTVWNTSFLFDLPPGNISQLPLMLEFIIMQVKSTLGAHSQRSKCMTFPFC